MSPLPNDAENPFITSGFSLSMPASSNESKAVSHLFDPSPSISNQISQTSGHCFVYILPPPRASDLIANIAEFGLPNKVYRDPYYSRESDAPERPREYAGLLFHLKGGDGLSLLEEWRNIEPFSTTKQDIPMRTLNRTGVGGWEYASSPPSVRQVRRWLLENPNSKETGLGPGKQPSQVSYDMMVSAS